MLHKIVIKKHSVLSSKDLKSIYYRDEETKAKDWFKVTKLAKGTGGIELKPPDFQ